MKKLTTLIVIILLTASSAAFSQGWGKGPTTPEQKAERMAERLNLSETQQQEVLTLFQENQAQHEALRSQRESLRNATQEKLSTILTSEQLEQMENFGPGNRGQRMHGKGRPCQQ